MTKIVPQVWRLLSITIGWRLPFRVLSLTLIILAISAGYGCARFGSLAAALAAVRGDPLVVDQLFKSISGVRPGSRVALRYALTNVSGHPIRLLGARTSCSCTVVGDLPITLAASETRLLKVLIATREDQAAFDGSIRLYTDDLRSTEIVVGYSLHFAEVDSRKPYL